MMKKIIATLLCIACLFWGSGCNSFFVDEEREIYKKTMKDLFTALDQQNVDAIYELFAPAMQNEALAEKIEELISVYAGPTEKIGEVPPLQGEGSYEMGEKCLTACGTFPVVSDGRYYWCYLELMYENTVDESRIGITQLDFYTDDAYYEFWSGDARYQEAKGLNLYLKDVDDNNIISINNYPYDYHPVQTIDLEDAKRFFETSTSMKDFAGKFGEPASTDEFGCVYPLGKQDGEDRYLYIAHEDDEILYCEILGNFSYIDTVLEE